MNGKKSKVTFFDKDKEFREDLKRLASESDEPLSEAEEEKMWDEFFKTPLGRKIALKLLKLTAEGAEDAEIDRTFNKMIYEGIKEEHKLFKNTEKWLKEKIIGIRNSKGGFTCLDCIAQEAWIYIDEDKTVTLFDLKDGALFQCGNCEKKISSSGTGQEITFIRFILDKVKE